MMDRHFLRGLVAAIFLLLAQSAIAAEIEGRVVGVSDGDTLGAFSGIYRI
jgi:hypothetical protein